MVAFLRVLPKLSGDAYRKMTTPPALAGGPPVGAQSVPILRPADTRRESPPFDEFLYAAPSTGFADESVHTNPVATCTRCHGADGSGAVTGGEAPNLTIQDAAYLQTALEAYTRGTRKSGFMQNIAAQLSGSQIAALAHYYAGLPVRASSPVTADPTLINRGAAIVFQGVPQTATPPCASCHESPGATISGAPHLAGQSFTFLRRQLEAMARGGRGSSRWWNPMPSVAHSLDASQIAAVAAYYSSLSPAKAMAGVTTAPSARGLSAQDARVEMAAAQQIFDTQCLKCHVNHGRGDLKGDYPNLTLQTAPFVAQSLYAFRSGARPGDKMRQMTGSLSLVDLASLAAYVGGLTPQPGMAKPDLGAAARGAAIALHGSPARGVPACVSCHGASGVADLPLIPRLQGQNALYLQARLDRFARRDARNLSALNPMPKIAGRLSAAERADLAAYFAAAAPLQKTAPVGPTRAPGNLAAR